MSEYFKGIFVKRCILLTLLFLMIYIGISLQAQDSTKVILSVPGIDQIKSEPINVNTGFSFKLHSVVLNEDRTIMISLPDGYNGNTKKYPVLFMLDGQWNFNHTAQTVGWISDKGIIPQTIVVGIHTGENRERDLTPTQNKENKLGGGADKFYKFIKEELIPFIDKNYRTYNYRVLGGVSLGALFVMNAFISDPQLFTAYLALSPSMWWDNRIMLNKTEVFLSKNPKLYNHLYVAMANEGTQMGVDSLATILKKYSSKELIWKYDKYPKEIHETVNYKGIWDGLKFVFADWSYPLVNFGTNGDLFSPQDSAINSTFTHKIVNLSEVTLERYSGLYLDSYGRILTFTKEDSNLVFSGIRLPTATLYPEEENKFFLTAFDVRFEFIKEDSLVVTANGIIDFTAKKIKHPPLVKLSDGILKRYVGTYTRSDYDNGLNITKEGNSLKLLEGTMHLTYLYPVGENRFFAFIKGSGFELEFIKDKSNKTIKMNVYGNGKLVGEAKRIKKNI
jgi:predicted alpha/beta superfamily hydrolase